MKVVILKKTLFTMCLFACFAALGADYHWTGAAGNCLWSDPGNWETSSGGAVSSVDVANGHTYNFGTRNGTDVGWGGNLVVTQDVNVVLGSALALNPLGGDGAETEYLEIVSADGCKLSTSGDLDIYVQRCSHLTLSVDMSGDGYGNGIQELGNGCVVWNLKAANTGNRRLALRGGTCFLGNEDGTSVVPKVGVMVYSSYDFTPSRFVDRINDASFTYLCVGRLDAGAESLGVVCLNGKTLNVGDEQNSTSTNMMPMAFFGDGGTLAIQHERRAMIRGLPIGGTLAVNRADAHVVTPNTAIRWLFDDADDPTRDVVGSGYRMLAPKGMPEIVTDATRGSVLSISDGKYFKGPDADAGLDGLQLQSTNNPYTVAFWFKPDSACDTKGKIFYWGGTWENYTSAALRLNDSETEGLMFTIWGTNKNVPTAASPRDGNWHHFAVVHDGLKSFKIYYDGANVLNFDVGKQWITSSTWNWYYFPPNKNLYIGAIHGGWVSNGENAYTGLLDDFLIGAYELTADQIAAVKENGLAAAITGGSADVRAGGEMAFDKDFVSVKTLSGDVLGGGLNMLADRSTLTVGAEAGEGATTFKGSIVGGGTTLVKEGADYSLALSGSAPAVTNAAVKEGLLTLRRPMARAGLVAYYSFDDADDLGADSSPSGFAVRQDGSGVLTEIADGVSGKAQNFGGGTYLKSTECLRARFPVGHTSYTVSMWIKPTAAAYTGNFPLFCWGKDGTPFMTSFMRLNGGGSGGVMFTHWGDNYEAKAGNLADGNWHHVVAVYDSATRTKTVYVDGTAYVAAANSTAPDIASGTCLYIGSRSQSTSTTYSGGMDEFMVFDYAWSADEVANEYARKTPVLVSAETLLPSPVAHWTFDDDENPGADSSANSLGLTKSGTVELESGDYICGKAARFSSSSGYFKLDSFPSQLPSGSNAFTVVVRYRPDLWQSSSYYPGIVMWGDTSGWDSGKLVKISTERNRGTSIRSTMCGQIIYPSSVLLLRTNMGTDLARWITVTYVYSPDANAHNLELYVDGECKYLYSGKAGDITAQEFSIGSNYSGTQNFYGLIDDVQIYDCALAPGQVRLVAEQLEAAKGGGTRSCASVLAANPDVSVSEGATLRVESVESVASLSGAGTIDIAPLGSLAVDKVEGFGGTLSGRGTLAISDNAVLDFGDGTAPVLEAAGTIALGSNVTVALTAKVSGSVVLSANSFAGVENLSTWKCSTSGRSTASRFRISADGKSVTMSNVNGVVVIVR